MELWSILVPWLQKARRENAHANSGLLTLHCAMSFFKHSYGHLGQPHPNVTQVSLRMLSGREGGKAAARQLEAVDWLSLHLGWSCLVPWLRNQGILFSFHFLKCIFHWFQREGRKTEASMTNAGQLPPACPCLGSHTWDGPTRNQTATRFIIHTHWATPARLAFCVFLS